MVRSGEKHRNKHHHPGYIGVFHSWDSLRQTSTSLNSATWLKKMFVQGRSGAVLLTLPDLWCGIYTVRLPAMICMV